MIRKLLFTLNILAYTFVFTQQNEEFRKAKTYFDQQGVLIFNQYRNEWNNQTDEMKRHKLNQQFLDFIKKMDSVRNEAYIQTLIKVKNREDISKILKKDTLEILANNNIKSNITQDAEYPNGINALRAQIAPLIYTQNIVSIGQTIHTNVIFIVEKDGSISSVSAEGNNPSFNKQVIIAIYLLPDKFSPALVKGIPVRSRFRMPVTLSL